jgi:hypothetical protein
MMSADHEELSVYRLHMRRDQHQKIRVLAALRGATMNEVIVSLLDAALEKEAVDQPLLKEKRR